METIRNLVKQAARFKNAQCGNRTRALLVVMVTLAHNLGPDVWLRSVIVFVYLPGVFISEKYGQ